jgi:predicted HTH domain antitoxin
MTEIVSTRVPDNMAKDLKEIEKEEKTDRATLVRKLLAKAIAEWKLEKALTLYCDGKITLWKAAKIAELSLWETMETVKERKIPFHYTPEDFREDFEKALKEK